MTQRFDVSAAAHRSNDVLDFGLLLGVERVKVVLGSVFVVAKWLKMGRGLGVPR